MTLVQLNLIENNFFNQIKKIDEKKSFPQLTMLSLGMGQDSSTIFYKLINDKAWRNEYAPNDLVVIASDTGNEHQQTYEWEKKLEASAKLSNVAYFFITKDMGYHQGNWKDLIYFYDITKTCGSKIFKKSCTDNLKIKPIYRFLEDYICLNYGIEKGIYKSGLKKGQRKKYDKKVFNKFTEQYGKINVLIGFSNEETKRILKSEGRPKWMKENIHFRYPLIEQDMNRADCQNYLLKETGEIPLPSNCLLCPYVNDIELLWLYRFETEWLQKWIEIEKNKIQHYRELDYPEEKNRGVWGTKDLLADRLTKALKKKYKQFEGKIGSELTDQELWDFKMSHGHCVASQY